MSYQSKVSLKIKNKIRFALSKMSQILAGTNAKGLLTSNEGLLFISPISDLGVSRTLRWYSSYAKDEQRLILALTNNTSSVAFIGSHIGAIAIPISKNVKRVLCVEGNPETYFYLHKNILINEIDNIEAINCFVGEAQTEHEFVLNSANSGGTKRMPLVRDQLYFYDQPTIQTFKMQTFDSLSSGVKYDLIFVDVEGSEYFVLKGMQNALSRSDFLIIEFVPHHLRNVSKVSVQTFLDQIKPFFSFCYIPRRDMHCSTGESYSVLQKAFEDNEEHNVILFSKTDTRIFLTKLSE